MEVAHVLSAHAVHTKQVNAVNFVLLESTVPPLGPPHVSLVGLEDTPARKEGVCVSLALRVGSLLDLAVHPVRPVPVVKRVEQEPAAA